jgi:hypothetical protein
LRKKVIMKTVVLLFISVVLFFSGYFLIQSKNTGAPSSLTSIDPAAVTDDVMAGSTDDSDQSATVGNTKQLQPLHPNEKRLEARSEAKSEVRPLEPEIRAAVKELVNTSHEGLVEKETQNGVEMNLRGRFRTAPVATVNEQGEVTVRDYTSAPAE